MIRRIALLLIMFFSSIALFAQVTDINPGSAKRKLKKDVIVLDVRTADEYKSGHIEGAVNIDVLDSTTFLNRIAKLEKDKTYLVYCRSGKRSANASTIMLNNGFSSL